MSTGIQVITSGMPHWPTFAPAWAGDVEVERDGGAATFTFARSWSIPSTHRGTDDATLLIVRQRFERPHADAAPIGGTPWVQAGESGLWADYRANEVASLLRSVADALAPHSASQAAQHQMRNAQPERGAR